MRTLLQERESDLPKVTQKVDHAARTGAQSAASWGAIRRPDHSPHPWASGGSPLRCLKAAVASPRGCQREIWTLRSVLIMSLIPRFDEKEHFSQSQDSRTPWNDILSPRSVAPAYLSRLTRLSHQPPRSRSWPFMLPQTPRCALSSGCRALSFCRWNSAQPSRATSPPLRTLPGLQILDCLDRTAEVPWSELMTPSPPLPLCLSLL